MRLLAALIAAFLVVVGCAPPNNAVTGATSADTLSFANGATFTPTTPIDGTPVVISWVVTNNSTNNTALNNIPYVINRDNVYKSGANISTIAPNGNATVTFQVQETDGAPHTYEMVLDPNDLTGASNPATNTMSITVPWQPIGSG